MFLEKINSQRGESLVEVIISVGILMLVIGPAVGINILSNRKADVAKKSLIAKHIAQDGVELVKVMRDSNLLKYKTKETQCWLTKPDFAGDISICDANENVLSSGSYRIQNTPAGIILTRVGVENSLSENLAALNDAQFNLHQGDNEYTLNPADPKTPFYRELNITLTDIDNADDVGNNATGFDTASVVSVVKFKTGNSVKVVSETANFYAK